MTLKTRDMVQAVRVAWVFSNNAVGATNKPVHVDPCLFSDSGSHYWEIATPEGPMSKGLCRHCGEKRDFINWIGWEFKR
jgi:hypothetical protein